METKQMHSFKLMNSMTCKSSDEICMQGVFLKNTTKQSLINFEVLHQF